MTKSPFDKSISAQDAIGAMRGTQPSRVAIAKIDKNYSVAAKKEYVDLIAKEILRDGKSNVMVVVVRPTT